MFGLNQSLCIEASYNKSNQKNGLSYSSKSTGITTTVVPEINRMDFLLKKMDRHFIQFESYIYNFAKTLIDGYTGGYWDFFELSNGGFYFKPSLGGMVNITVSENYFSNEVSEDVAGIIITIFAFSHLLSKTMDEKHYDLFEKLNDFVREHPERGLILAAID